LHYLKELGGSKTNPRIFTAMYERERYYRPEMLHMKQWRKAGALGQAELQPSRRLA
jgi:hypothetical protein